MNGGMGGARASLGGRPRGVGLGRGMGGAVLVAAIGALAVLGCTGSGPPREEIVSETAALRTSAPGLLRDAHAAPVAGALVEARPAGGGPLVACDTTATDGAFVLRIRAGIYDLRVTPRGVFAPQSFPAQAIGGVGTLELVMMRHGAAAQLSGRIVDQNGTPLAGLYVCGSTVSCWTTGDDGTFQVTDDGNQPHELTIFGGPSSSQASGTFNVSSTSNVTEGSVGDIVLPLFNLVVHVVDAGGTPVVGAPVVSPTCYPVNAEGLEGTACMYQQPQPDATGAFHFVTLPGTVQLVVVGSNGTFVSVPVAGDTDFTIDIPPSQRLSGRVVNRDGSAQNMTSICVQRVGCTLKYCGFTCANSDSDGRYSLDVPGGDYKVEVRGYGPDGPYDISKNIDLTQPQELNVTLQNQQLTGQVLDMAGAPAPGAVVVAWCYPVDIDGLTGILCPNTRVTDANGRFTYELAAPGTATLVVEGATPASQVVTVGDGTEVRLQLRAPAPASGRLVDSDGQALPDASVCIDVNLTPVCATTDADGHYELAVAPGIHDVSAAVSGQSSLFADFLRVEVSSAPVTLQTVAARGFAGQLVGPDGRPIVGAAIVMNCARLTRTDFNESLCAGTDVFTDDAGRFNVQQLPGAPLDLTVLLPGDASGISIPIKDVTAGGKATSVTVAIQPAPASAPAPCAHPARRARTTVAVAPHDPIAAR
jgi:protocatechuate 3,4-dioxygenase beta subunit